MTTLPPLPRRMPGHAGPLDGPRPAAAWCRRLASFAVVLGVALGGCGGGVDSGGTGAPAVAYASGPIAGFGSVIVNGVHFDERAAQIVDGDGNVRSRDDLRLGMTTEINGSKVTVDASGIDTSVASRIVFSSAMLGPVSSVDAAGSTFVVLGQPVGVGPSTVFDDSLAGGLAALAPGDVVEVYALQDLAAGRTVATRVERRTGAASYALRGAVAGLDGVAKTFRLGALTVSFAAVPASHLPPGLADGLPVRVRLATAPASGVWPIVAFGAAAQRPADRDETRIEGLVSSFVSTASFGVDGVAIDAARAAFPDGTAGLTLGARVRIEGVATGSTVIANKVELRSENEIEAEGFEVDGRIDAIDVVARTFVVRGVVVDYAGSVEFRDGTVANLASGVQVEVRGTLAPGGTSLKATRIRFRP